MNNAEVFVSRDFPLREGDSDGPVLPRPAPVQAAAIPRPCVSASPRGVPLMGF